MFSGPAGWLRTAHGAPDWFRTGSAQTIVPNQCRNIEQWLGNMILAGFALIGSVPNWFQAAIYAKKADDSK